MTAKKLPKAISLKGGDPKQGKPYERVRSLPRMEEDCSKPGIVSSRLDHTATISYNGESLLVPPRSKEKIGNLDKLGALPKGVVVRPLNPKK